MSIFRSRNINMTEGRPLSLMLSFAVPLMFGNIFQQLYTVTDTAIIGRGVGIRALAALGAVDWLAWLPFCIPQGFAQGFSVRASQKFGEGDLPGLRKVVGLSFRISVIIAILCTAASLLLVPWFMQILNVREELAPLASSYLYILFGGFAAAVMYNYAASMLRAVGDSKTPLLAMVVSSVINITLDALTVFVFKWGIIGAAGATVLSQIIAGTICMIRMSRMPELRFKREDMKRDRHLSGQLVRLGLPMCLMNVIICIGGLVVQSVVNRFSVGFIAGYTATNKLYGILEIAAVSYSYAITTYVGQNFGAGNKERIRSGVVTGLYLSIATAAVIGAILFIFGRQLTGLFISRENPEAYLTASNTSYRYLQYMAVLLPVLYILYVYRSALQGLGDMVVPMISGIIEFAIRVGIALYVGFLGSEQGIFYAEVSAWLGAAVFLCVMYYVKRERLMMFPDANQP